jgi:hypothetical protein
MPKKYDIVIPQRDPQNTKFVERIISGSNLFLATDPQGKLIGTDNLPPFNISGSSISASALFVQGKTDLRGPLVATSGSFTNIVFNPGAPAPITSNSYGMPGELRTDNNFLYLFLNNKWRRAPFNLFQ